MNFLKNIFTKKEASIGSYEDFWNWFQKNEKDFFNVVKLHKNVEADFLNKLSSKLNELKEGFFYLTGMFNETTAELILTADGVIKNIVFVEELVNNSPKIDGWKFTALKPALDIENVNIKMDIHEFNRETLWFYANDFNEYPDEIDITVVHKNLNEENKSIISNGTYIFLDNYLGELNFATTIDNLKIVGPTETDKELIPIEKIKDYLNWRQKEFIEKYEEKRYSTEKDTYSMLEAELQSGKILIAVINTDLLDWENKASHPWIVVSELKYDGSKNNGMPDKETYNLLNEIENKIMEELKDSEGYLNVGRQTSDNIREIYFVCNEFRKPSKVLQQIQDNFMKKIDMDYNIYKDKYWRSFERFNRH